MIKIGIAPFHFWFPEVVEGLDWNRCLLILTWQKIAPSCILIYVITPNLIIISAIILSAIIRRTLGINITRTRKILTYSSINHIAWIIATIMMSPTLWIIYFLTYALTNYFIVTFFKKHNINRLSQYSSTKIKKKSNKLFLRLNLLSLGGIPPFIGFFPKWSTIIISTEYNIYTITLVIIIFTLLTLFFYIRIAITSFSLKESKILPIKNYSIPLWIPIFNFILILRFALIPSLSNLL